MKIIKTLTAVAAAVSCLTVTSQATVVLPPGTNPSALGGDVALDPGAVLLASLSSPFAFGGAFSGTLTSTVYQENAVNNPLGGYTFLYTIANAGTSTDSLRRFTVDGWANALPNVVAGNTGPGIDADSADRSLNGDIIGFNWLTTAAITPGGFGEVFIRTSLQHYTTDNASLIDSGTATVNGLAVPEPTTMIAGALLLLPFGASTLRTVRRRTA